MRNVVNHGNLISTILIVIHIKLFFHVHSQYVTIWDDKMNNPNGWIGFNDFDLAYASANCLGGVNVCARVRAKNGNSDIYKSTDITLYSALQLEFDVNVHALEGADRCQVWYSYDEGDYIWGWEKKNGAKHYSEMVSFSKPLSTNTLLWIYLEVKGNATDGSDRCYWDNLILRGILHTSSPTLQPSKYPTLNPTLYPSKYPTLYPSKY
eukprot:464130_1